MKPLFTLLSSTILIALLTGCSYMSTAEPTSGYWVFPGAGKHDGIHLSHVICKDGKQCMIFRHDYNTLAKIMKQYNLDNLSFKSLKSVAVATNKEGDILLPDDLGEAIYSHVRNLEALQD